MKALWWWRFLKYVLVLFLFILKHIWGAGACVGVLDYVIPTADLRNGLHLFIWITWHWYFDMASHWIYGFDVIHMSTATPEEGYVI